MGFFGWSCVSGSSRVELSVLCVGSGLATVDTEGIVVCGCPAGEISVISTAAICFGWASVVEDMLLEEKKDNDWKKGRVIYQDSKQDICSSLGLIATSKDVGLYTLTALLTTMLGQNDGMKAMWRPITAVFCSRLTAEKAKRRRTDMVAEDGANRKASHSPPL